MNQSQVKFLRERVARVRLSDVKHPPEPKSVTKARGVIDAYEKRQSAIYKSRREKMVAARKKCLELIWFGAAPDALKAVQKFEETTF